MVWEEQRKGDVKFVDWGELKTGHNPDDNIIVKKGEELVGSILRISDHETYGHIYRLGVKGIKVDVIVKGNASINRQMLGEGLTDDQLKNFVPVSEGNKVKFIYNGMYTTKSGGKGYDITVLVDR